MSSFIVSKQAATVRIKTTYIHTQANKEGYEKLAVISNKLSQSGHF